MADYNVIFYYYSIRDMINKYLFKIHYEKQNYSKR